MMSRTASPYEVAKTAAWAEIDAVVGRYAVQLADVLDDYAEIAGGMLTIRPTRDAAFFESFTRAIIGQPDMTPAALFKFGCAIHLLRDAGESVIDRVYTHLVPHSAVCALAYERAAR